MLGACSGLVHRGQAPHQHRVRRGKNKQTLEEEEGELEDGTLDKGARIIQAPPHTPDLSCGATVVIFNI